MGERSTDNSSQTFWVATFGKCENVLYVDGTKWIDTSADVLPTNWCKSYSTHLFLKGLVGITAQLTSYFTWFGFNRTSKSVYNFIFTKLMNLDLHNRRPVVQWYFPLWSSKWVFSGSNVISGQSCKHFTLVNNDSIVVITSR